MKRYGDTKTVLNLTEKAQAFYNETDPIDIYETTGPEGPLYRLFIGDQPAGAELMTADQLNRYLEDGYNANRERESEE